MTIELDPEQIIEEITDSSTFTSWLHDQIDERVPEHEDSSLPYDVTRDSQLDAYVASDDLASEMRQAFEDHDTSWFGITVETDLESAGNAARQLLDTLPADSASRCALGRAFERAVVKVIDNLLSGSDLQGVGRDFTKTDELFAAMLNRVANGVVDTRGLEEERDEAARHAFSETDRVTCDEGGEGNPHDWNPACINPVLVSTVDVSDTGHPIDEPAYTDPLDALTPIDPIDPDARFVREVMVLPINGDRETWGTVTVHVTGDDQEFLVRKNRSVYRAIFATAEAAFTDAFRNASWGLTVTRP